MRIYLFKQNTVGILNAEVFNFKFRSLLSQYDVQPVLGRARLALTVVSPMITTLSRR
jgi:hypothetical protein